MEDGRSLVRAQLSRAWTQQYARCISDNARHHEGPLAHWVRCLPSLWMRESKLILNSLGVRGITDFIECSDQILEPVLLQGDAHVQDMVSRRGPVALPPLGSLRPGVLDLEVIPPFGSKRLRRHERYESEQDSRGPDHGEERALGSALSIAMLPIRLYRPPRDMGHAGEKPVKRATEVLCGIPPALSVDQL